MAEDPRDIQSRFGVVGREIELRKALAVIRAGKHLLIEGPVGVGKTILAEAVAKFLDKPLYRVDGDERYTEQKLTGWFDPPLVIKNGYSKDAFLPGPLTLSMEDGGVLFINELNRMPEGVQNVLLPAMDEARIEVPKIGTITARNGFIVISTQNPREFIATSLLSEALRDRFELLTLDYQSEDEEVTIVQRRTGIKDARFVRSVVRLVRASRAHPDIRRGASVRAAMSISTLTYHLGLERKAATKEAAHMTLPTRIELKADARKSVHEIVDELLEDHWSETPGEVANEDPPALAPTKSMTSKILPAELLAEDDAIGLLENLGIVDLKDIPADAVDWSIAQHYTDIKRQVKDQRLLRKFKRIAIRAIIHHTLQLLGPTRRRMEFVREPYAPGQTGDIEIEMTAEEMLGKSEIGTSDLIVESKVPRQMACVMMLDTSISMSGDKLGLATASLGALAFKLKSIEYGVITFDNVARLMKRLGQRVEIESLVGDLLDVAAVGLTNIEDGLRKGLNELTSSRAKDKVGVMITDGNYTAGKDPCEVATEYPQLFVIMVKSHDSKPQLCERMAGLGKGKFVTVDTFEEIPRVLRNLLGDFVYRPAVAEGS
ncbi:MAG TPA: AAA family ATPase [Candidatus Acidoferrales bacterium]|nr:AAA family ATPase [Candidatus Acidoferrales bacterium]